MREDLGDGLILRASTPDDTEAIGEFFAKVFADRDTKEPAEWAPPWIRDLMCGHHPTVSPSDFTVVEDTKNGQIASCCGFIPQVWRYGGDADGGPGIEFPVGQPELVGTGPDYRRRGLVRKQFDVLHRWSEERGHLVQVINGIPNYYRQFGYEMTIEKSTGRIGSVSHVPNLGKDEEEAYVVRDARPDDMPFFVEMYEQSIRRTGVSCVRPEEIFRFEFDGREEQQRDEYRVIERKNGDRVGALLYMRKSYKPLYLYLYELVPGVSWIEVTPAVLRWTRDECRANAVRDEKASDDDRQRGHGFRFEVPTNHPVLEAIPEKLPEQPPPFAWFVRVPDLPRFLNHVSPVLERRLERSVACGHSGELKISFYRDGLRMVLENGRLTTIEPWRPTVEDEGHARFPDLTFLHLVFGYRTLDEVREMFADCGAEPWAAALLHALFPKRPANVWNIT